MRHSIFGFDQQTIIDLYENITVGDLLLLDYIYNAIASPTMEHYVDGDDIYVWLSHKKILEDLPMLNISDNRLRHRLSSLVDNGLLKTYHTCIPGVKGSKAFYCITKDCESLRYGPGVENNIRSKDQMLKITSGGIEPGVENNTSNNKLNDVLVSKDTNTKDKQLKDRSQKPLLNTSSLKQKDIDKFVDLYHKHCIDLPRVRAITDKRKVAIHNIIRKYSWDDIITVFDLAQESDFLKHGAGDGGWNGAGIDFILREDKFVSILEGKYNNKKRVKSADGLLTPRARKDDMNERKYQF